MANDWMGQILGHVLGGGASGQPAPGGGSGGLGDVLGGMLGGGATSPAAPAIPGGAGRGTLLAMLLPLAMQWVQRNGGVGAVLDRFRQKGYGAQANSWVSTSPNQPLNAQQVHEVVGPDELSQKLGVDQQQVASGLAEVLPRMVDHLTPQGQVTPQSDQALDRGRISLEQALEQLRAH